MPDITAQWLGHSTFIVTTPEGFHVLIDPWVHGNPATPPDARDHGPLDLILVTHGHFDHIDDCIPIAQSTGAPVLGIFEICLWLNGKGVANTIDMNKGGTVQVGPVQVTMVHADHSCGIQDGDTVIYGGEAVGYILHFSNGRTLWHMGDTAVFGDMALLADLYKPDAIMMPIGNHYVMSPFEAARAIHLTGAKRVIPMHFGTFPVLTGTPSELKSLTADIAGLEIVELQPGETATL